MLMWWRDTDALPGLNVLWWGRNLMDQDDCVQGGSFNSFQAWNENSHLSKCSCGCLDPDIDLPFPSSRVVRIVLTWVQVMWGTPDWHRRCFFLLWDLRDLEGNDRLGCQCSLPEGGKGSKKNLKWNSKASAVHQVALMWWNVVTRSNFQNTQRGSILWSAVLSSSNHATVATVMLNFMQIN